MLNILSRRKSLLSDEMMMNRYAFKCQVFDGKEVEFGKRFKEIWPELIVVASTYGVQDLSIYIDEYTNEVSCVLYCEADWNKEALFQNETFLLWRLTMNSLLDTNEESMPIVKPLSEVFQLKGEKQKI